MLTLESLNLMTEKPEYNGFGYLGHECRNVKLDQLLIKVLNQNNLDFDLSNLLLNSRPGRYMGDELMGLKEESSIIKIINKYISREIPLLRKEVRERN